MTYSIDASSTQPAWLNFDAAGPTFYGIGAASPTPNSPALKVVATDTIGQTTFLNLNIGLTTNIPPSVRPGKSFPNLTIKNMQNFSNTFADNVIMDAEGDPTALSFLRSDGSAMPSWWSYNPITRVASGFCNTTETSITVKVIAGITDVGLSFTLAISTNNNPVVGTTISDIIGYQDINFTSSFSSSSFTDADGDTLTYYLEAETSNSALPMWLEIVSDTKRIYGRPSSTDKGEYKVKIVADDSRGGTASQIVKITIYSSYGIFEIMGVSLLTILPILLFFGFIGAIIFVPHESPKYDFDVDEFIRKYNQNYISPEQNQMNGEGNGFERNEMNVKVDSL